MSKLELFSEPYARTGNIAAEGFKNLLGRPSLALLPTMVREAVQNSVDAAVEDAPEIFIRVRDLGEEQVELLESHVFTMPASPPRSMNLLRDRLATRSLKVMEICDFGTTGLGGPTRADLVVAGEDPDFVNFMRNVGAARDTHQGGGTYGYGKSSLYAMSNCATILVDTATRAADVPVRRLMAAHLGEAFEQDIKELCQCRRFTGRHWWGVADQEDGIDPLEGVAAEKMAQRLGLPERASTDTGTTIVIIDPGFEESSSTDIADTLVETILWNFWPRMVRSTPSKRRLRISLEVDGQQVIIPEPETFPPLDLFAQAMKNIREDADSVELIKSLRPKKELGKLSICTGATAQRTGVALKEKSPFRQPSARIALMRPVELVVRYIEGVALPDSRFEWAGVFRCSDEAEVEEAFARAEPPAHDDWIPDNLPRGPNKTWVNVAMREISSRARDYCLPASTHPSSDSAGPSLAQAAARLGSLLGPVSSRGPGVQRRSTRSASSRKSNSPAITPPVVNRLQDDESFIYAVFAAEVRNAGEQELTLSADAYLVADGGATKAEDLPAGLAPRVMRIRHLDTGREATGDQFSGIQLSGNYEITVRMTSDAAVGLRLRFEEQKT